MTSLALFFNISCSKRESLIMIPRQPNVWVLFTLSTLATCTHMRVASRELSFPFQRVDERPGGSDSQAITSLFWLVESFTFNLSPARDVIHEQGTQRCVTVSHHCHSSGFLCPCMTKTRPSISLDRECIQSAQAFLYQITRIIGGWLRELALTQMSATRSSLRPSGIQQVYYQ